MRTVVGYAPTPEGAAALAVAITATRHAGGRLVVVNTSGGTALVDPRDVTDDQLTALEAQLTEAGVEHGFVHSISGREPAEEILATAEREHADLVVIGIRRRSAVGKLIMGSTAQRVLLGASCPVLAVKAPH